MSLFLPNFCAMILFLSRGDYRMFLACPRAFSRHLFLHIALAFRSCVLFG
jgi:hypothetical protein